MATQDAILKLILDTQGVLRKLSDLTREWLQSTKKMDRAAEGVDFDLARQQTEKLERAIKELSSGAITNLARIEKAAEKAGSSGLGKTTAESKRLEKAIQKLAQDADRQLSKIERAAERVKLDRIRKEAREAEKEFQRLEKSVDKMAKESEKDLRKVEKAIDKVKTDRLRQEAREASAEIKGLERSATKSFAILERRAQAAGNQLREGIGNNLTRLSPKVDELRRRFEAATRRMADAGDRVSFEKARKEARRLEADIDRMGKEASRDLDKLRASSKSAQGGLSSLADTGRRLRTVMGSLGIIIGVREIIELGRSAVEASIRLEAFQAQMRASTKTVEDAAVLLAFAEEQSERLGLSFPVLTEATARFAAATKNVNLTLDQQREILLSVFEASRVLNLSNQRLNNTLLALEQIASKSTVSMEELRRQLGDNIPGAVAILAKQMDVSQEKLLKLIETNQVLSEDALPLLAKGFREAFGEGVQGALDTTAAKIGRLNKQVFDLKVAFSEGLEDQLVKDIERLSESAAESEEGFRSLGRLAGFIIKSLGDEARQTVGFVENVKDGFQALFDFIPESAERALTGLSSIGSEVEEVQRALLDAFADTQVGELDDAVRSLVEAYGLLVSSGTEVSTLQELNKDSYEILVEIVEDLVDRLDELDESGQKAVRGIAQALGITVPAAEEAKTALDKVQAALEESRQKSEELAREFTGTRDKAEELTRNLELLAEGLDLSERTRLTKDQIRELRQEVENADNAWSSIGETAPESIDRISDSLDRLEQKNKLDEVTDDVRNLIETFGGLDEIDFESLTLEQLDELKDRIQKALDAWEVYGEEVPEDIQQVADALGVTTSAVEKELKEQEKELEKAAKKWERETKKIRDSIESIGETFLDLTSTLRGEDSSDEVADLRDTLRELEDQRFNFEGSLEDLAELDEKIAETRDEIREAEAAQESLGETTQETADVIDDALRKVVEDLGPVFGRLTEQEQAAVEGILSNLQLVGQSGQASAETVQSSLQQMIGVLEAAGQPTGDLRAALNELRDGSFDLETAFDTLREEIKDGEEGLSSYNDETRRAREEQKKLVEELAEGATKIKELRRTYEGEVRIISQQLEVIKGHWVEINELCERHKRCLGG